MAYTRLSAAEAAAMINDQDTIGLSGFTPNGVPKSQSFGRVDENYIKNSLHSIEGVKAVRLDDNANTITVEYDDSKVSPATLESELKKNNFL